MPSKAFLIASWILQAAAAAILLQTLYFKFTGAEDSRYLFSRLGVEPWGRWAAGSAELVAAILLLHPRTAAIGAALALGIIGGAIFSHLTKLGIVVKDDGGLLFGLAIAVLVCSSGVLFIRHAQLPVVGPHLATLLSRAHHQ